MVVQALATLTGVMEKVVATPEVSQPFFQAYFVPLLKVRESSRAAAHSTQHPHPPHLQSPNTHNPHPHPPAF